MISGRSGVRSTRISTPRQDADAEREAAAARARVAAAVRAALAPSGALVVAGIEWRVAVVVVYDGLATATAAIAPSGLVSVRSSASTRWRAPADVARELAEDLRGGIEDAHSGIVGLAERLRGGPDPDLRALVLGLYQDDKPRRAAIRLAALRLVDQGDEDPRIVSLSLMRP